MRARRGRLLFVLLASVLCIMLGAVNRRYSFESRPSIEAEGLDMEKGIGKWIVSFTDKDFIGCDSFIEDDKDKILSNSIYNYMNDTEVYEELMRGISDSLVTVSLKSRRDYEGGATYTFDVEYNVFKKADNVNLRESNVRKIIRKYVREGDRNKDMQSKLRDEYIEAMKLTCLSKKNGSTAVSTFTLTEEETDEGVFITGTSTLVRGLLSSTNALSNLKVFEDNVTERFSKLLEEE